MMLPNSGLLTERRRSYVDVQCRDDPSSGSPTAGTEVAFVQRLPQALSYAANLDRGDHAVLFYDNLVVAAEYFCAYIDEGIKRQEATCFIGLPHVRYEKLFEQVGVKVAQLENCGYLSHFSIQDFCMEKERLNENMAFLNIKNLLRDSNEPGCKGIRIIHIQELPMEHNASFQDVMEFEQWLKTLYNYPVSAICAYDAKTVLDDAPPHLFTDLLMVHGHCFFQGVAMATDMLLGTQMGASSAKLRSP